MKRIDYRISLGLLLILAGALLLMEQLGWLRGAFNIFWGMLLALGGLYFLGIFLSRRARGWSAIPAFTLLGLAAATLLPSSLEILDGLFFLGGIGLGFFALFAANRRQWWALIPGGVLVTLGVISVLDEIPGTETDGVFFVGLGLTFLLVALLPGERRRLGWAYIPAAALLILGLVLGVPYFPWSNYLWPVILLIAGVYLILRYFRLR
ncbi:MAG: hypothetical protein D6770_00460 [Anaerolineae bacterium]|nr:MAG: hypothetical protein D6770_00460 [Anaerolineae bacterium]